MRSALKVILPIAFAWANSYGQEAGGAATGRIPAGTVTVRTIDPIESKSAQVGQSFQASLDEPVTVEGKVLPKGSVATLRLIEARSAGRLKGSAQLTITLVSVTADGKVYEANTESVTQESAGKGKSSATKVGVATGIGAAVGGILGRGKGAAIGAGAGAAAGTVLAVTTGPEVKIPSETRLAFKVN